MGCHYSPMLQWCDLALNVIEFSTWISNHTTQFHVNVIKYPWLKFNDNPCYQKRPDVYIHIKTLTLAVLRLGYSRQARTMQWLLMPWLLWSPCHLQPTDCVQEHVGTCTTPWPAWISIQEWHWMLSSGILWWNGQMIWKVKVNDPHFQYQLRESQDAYLV